MKHLNILQMSSKDNIRPLVSVIIPIYNSEKYLAACLESITKQSLTNIEIICVDDGSEDSSIEVIRTFACRDARIKMLFQVKQGAGAARNLGFREAIGEYVYFMDSDDYCTSDMLEKSVELIEQYDADMVVFEHKTFDSNTGNLIYSNNFQYREPTAFEPSAIKRLFETVLLVPWNKVMKAKLLRDNDIYFQNLFNNNDVFCIMLSIATSKKIVLLPEKLYFYRTNTNMSLQQTVGKDPFCCIEARALAKQELINRGVFNKFENAFINEFYSGIFNQLTRIDLTWDVLVTFRNKIRERFDFTYVTIDKVYNKTAYACVQGLFFDKTSFNIRDLLIMLKDSRREMFFLKDQNKILKQALDQEKNSDVAIRKTNFFRKLYLRLNCSIGKSSIIKELKYIRKKIRKKNL